MSLKQKTKKSTKQYPQPLAIPNPTYIAYFDGAYESVNLGGTAAYGTIIMQDGQPIWECSELLYPEQGKGYETSNNVVEYCGLIAVLEHLLHIGAQHEPIMVYGDSQLVIQQMFGQWKIKEGCYVPYALKAQALCRAFSNLHGQWIPRRQNTVADALSKRPLQAADIAFRLQPDEPWMPQEQNTVADALSKVYVQKAGVPLPLRLGDDEQDAYYDRNYVPVRYTPMSPS